MNEQQGSAGDSGAGKQTPAQLPGPHASRPATGPCPVHGGAGYCRVYEGQVWLCKTYGERIREALVEETALRMFTEEMIDAPDEETLVGLLDSFKENKEAGIARYRKKARARLKRRELL